MVAMRKAFKTMLLSAVLLAAVLPLQAQKRGSRSSSSTSDQPVRREAVTLQGVVSDSQGVLPGASVYVTNEDDRIICGEITGVQGEFIMRVPPSSQKLTLVVAFVGYTTYKTPFTGQTEISVTLQEASMSIRGSTVESKRVVKDHMGIEKENLGIASEVIDLVQFEDMSVISVEDMLQGKVANLDIVSASGDPGTMSTIRIRGASSLSANNEPLIVIDGIPQDNEIDDDFDFGDADVENFGALLNISPNDIQSIEVLKDAAATALWGSRAANGVLLVTTKQGAPHAPRFSLSQKFNYTVEPPKIPMLNGSEYVTLMQDAMWNWIQDGEFANNRVNKLTGQKDILYDPSYEYFDEFNCDTDWLGLITRNSLNSTTDFSMDGGGEMANYRFSLGRESQEGTTYGTDYERITSRLNLTVKFSKKFRVESKFNYTESTRNLPYGTTSADISSSGFDTESMVTRPVRNTAMLKMPNMSPWVLDDLGRPTAEYFTPPENCLQGIYPNSLAHVRESENVTKVRAVGATFGFFYTPFKGFNIISNIAYNLQSASNNSFLPASVINVKWSNKSYNQGVEAQTNKATTFAEIRMNYTRAIEKHNIVVSFADQLESSNNNSYSITTSGNGSKEVSSPSSEGKIVSMSSGSSLRRTMGLMGSFNYVYDQRYAVTVSGRLNANSNTGRTQRWSNIRPSVSAVWRVNNEPFMKKYDKVEDLRVRASWGRSDRVPNTSYVTGTFAHENDYMDLSSIKPSKMQLDNLRPEIVTQTNFGIDGAFDRNLVTFSVDYYDKRTQDLLMQNMAIQSSTGYNTVRWFNAGNIRNYGVEFTISLNNIIKKDKFRMSIQNLNISRNVNMITRLPSTMVAEKYTLRNGNYARKIIEGRPVGSISGFIFDGIYQNYDETLARDAEGNLIHDINGDVVPMRVGGTFRMHPGDSKYRDINYDGVIDENDIVYLGSSYPTVTGGGAIVFNYGPWQLRTSLHYRLGQYIVNMSRHDMEGMYNANNCTKRVLTRWRYEGDQTDVPRALWGTNYNSLGCSKFVENASFLKIKDVTLRYNVPQKLYRKLHLSRASIYATTYNLVTFTGYSGQDPEVAVEAGTYGLAFDRSKTPPSRRFALGMTIDF